MINVDYAKEYGIAGALLLSQIEYWTNRNAKLGLHHIDGHYWTRQTLDSYCKTFPYLTAKQIRYALEKLSKRQVIVIGKYDKDKNSVANWYTLKEKSAIKPVTTHMPILANAFDKKEKKEKKKEKEKEPKRKINKINKKNKKTLSVSARAREEDFFDEQLFGQFWKTYPKQIGEWDCREWFRQNHPSAELVGQMIAAIKSQKNTRQWQEESGRYIPYPAKWLEGHRWQDNLNVLGKSAEKPSYDIERLKQRSMYIPLD